MTHIVTLSGSLSAPSRTRDLVERIALRAAHDLQARIETIDVAELAPALLGALTLGQLPEPVAAAQRKLAAADLIVIGTPVYKASYSGLLKHFLDLIEPTRLAGKVAILAATGGSDRHALVIEHQLRPLASFFEIVTVPAGVYARDSEFLNHQLASRAVAERIELAVVQARRLLTFQAAAAVRDAAAARSASARDAETADL